MTEGRIIRRSTSPMWTSESAPSQEKRFDGSIWKWDVVMDGYKPVTITGRTQSELNENIAKRLGIVRESGKREDDRS